MSDSSGDHSTGTQVPDRNRIFSLAGSLLFLDRRYVLTDLVLLFFPFLLMQLAGSGEIFTILLMRLSEALVLLRVVRRVVSHFQAQRTDRPISGTNVQEQNSVVGYWRMFLRVFILSLFYYFILIAPLILAASGMYGGAPLLLLAFFFLPVGAYLAVRYYFAHFLVCFEQCSVVESLRFSSQVFRRDWFLPILISLFGLGVLGVVSQSVMAVAPHGGNLTINVLSELGIVLSKLVVSYLFSTAAVLALDSALAHRLRVLPYLEERVETLLIQSPLMIRRVFRVATITPLIFLTLIVFALNQNRLQSMPPFESFSVVSAEVMREGSTPGTRVRVVIDSVDERYLHYAFAPMSFRLANETGEVVLASFPAVVEIDGYSVSPVFPQIGGRAAMRVILDFVVQLTPEGIEQTTDLYLWYRKTVIDRIEVVENASP